MSIKLKGSVFVNINESFSLGGDDIPRYKDKLCVLDVDDSRTKIIAEAHGSIYPKHPGSTKMHHDLKDIYWWNEITKDIAEYVAKCPNCK